MLEHREDQAHISGVSHLLGGDIVTFRVGNDEPKSFIVHKRLLTHKVPIFENFFSSNLGHGVGEVISLPHDEPATFALFLDWIYTGELCVEIGSTMNETEGTMSALLNLYYFADKHNTRVLPDLLMDKILSISRQFRTSPNLTIVDDGYSSTKSGSKMRLYLARCFTLYTLHDHESAGRNYSPDMLHSLAMKHPDLLRDFFHIVGGLKVDSDHPSLNPKCDYHEHSPDITCSYL